MKKNKLPALKKTMTKNLIGKLITIHFSDRKTPISGVLIDFSVDWALLQYNPVDYVIDGCMIIRNKNVIKIERAEKLRSTIIQLKNVSKPKKKIPLKDISTMLSFLSKAYGVFHLETKAEDACYLGKLKSFDEKKFSIDFLTPEAKWKTSMTFKNSEIRIIVFDTDYINSLKLVAKK